MLRAVYDELRRLAEVHAGGQQGQLTLQPTVVVHELYLRLLGGNDLPGENRGQFFRAAATAMRRIVIDHYRARMRDKRGAGRRPLPLDETWMAPVGPNLDLLALDESLDELATLDERKSRVVELRFFGGLTVREVAQTLDTSVSTVEREWDLARSWLLHSMRSGEDS